MWRSCYFYEINFELYWLYVNEVSAKNKMTDHGTELDRVFKPFGDWDLKAAVITALSVPLKTPNYKTVSAIV